MAAQEMQNKPGGLRDAIFMLWRKFRNRFSTTEIRTGAVWTDGKEIYRKVISMGALPNNTTKNTAHGITGMTAVISLTGVATNGTIWRSLPYPDATLTDVVELDIGATNVTLRSTGDQSAFTSSFAIVEYTK
jgi:hypothetical protein